MKRLRPYWRWWRALGRAVWWRRRGQADTFYLINALNVLNDSEINYKSARNKRLHVELALIKLCYLAQACR